ncbi:hypothetical protein BYT27DRAFT_7256979 [Phlegmacium glaucopus]|nr:hypothetical protein BYT27DRAFT_7256979 [Phlegmacium glaucopus]
MSPPSAPFERSFYVGNAFGGILYGLQIYMVFHSCSLLLKSEPGPPGLKVKLYMIYGFAMLALTTIALSTDMIMGQYMWIEHRDYPGGPYSYYIANGASWINVLGTTACIAGNILNDALLLYRCYMIWNKSWRIMVAPFTIFLGTIAMALIALTQSALPNSCFIAIETVDFIIPWMSLTTGLNAIVTLLISGRILYYTRLASFAKGSSGTSDPHTGIVAILVESALPLSILGILCAVYFGNQDVPGIAFVTVWGGFVPISSQLIILRVAMGRAWTSDTSSKFGLTSSMQFAEREMDCEGSYVYRRSVTKTTFSDNGTPMKSEESVHV